MKTRLGREIGAVEASWWFRHQLTRLVHRVGRDPRWRTVMAIAPDTALTSRAVPAWVRRMPQGQGDLGSRIARALAAQPAGPALLIGADVPGVRACHIAHCFEVLGQADAVLGPAEDGGFWAIGLSSPRPLPTGIFAGARWSTPHAMADTVARLDPRRIGIADRLGDVDTAADLKRLAEPIGRRVP
ncbi:MAG: DUF2064 domain-containing protein [Pikeienuella sp.]